jgi:class 3 adenylate cyclase
LGDNVSIAARLASQVGQGEVLLSGATYEAAKIMIQGLEKRELDLKGKSEAVPAMVLRVTGGP